ncbi:enhanced level of genomic instability 1 isoform X3 [Polyergus mexicanus]|uniref:enhanced level of genomic instability 1 isoform X3 n=1 Tax=Polyergus mexicanus TaxID=615972 RepID=UPI0038B4C32A
MEINLKKQNIWHKIERKLCNEVDSRREESNAFQVLMNRSKPIQYKELPQQSIEDIENKKKLDDVKELRSRHKEKLIVLADKKGYLKRKIAEMEEGERIEKNIENRMRFFKSDVTDDITCKRNDSIGLSIKNNKQQSGNLLDYFSKSPLGSTNEDEKDASTFIVKADVHRTDNSDIEPVEKSISNRIYSSERCSKLKNFSTVDDIHIIASENLYLTQTDKQDVQKREKPRWSLRIKLHSTEENDSSNDTTDDELFSLRNKSKFNTSNKSRNSINMEDKKVYSKTVCNSYIKMSNKEKKESIGKQKEDNVQNTAKDAIVIDNNRDDDIRTKKSNKLTKVEQKDTNETIITMTDSECEIINEYILKRKPNEKLAPLFIKRRKTNPIVTAARRSFLQSDIIDIENKNIDRKVHSNSSISILPFPTISHVTQLEDTSDSIRVEIEYKFSTKVERKYLPSIDVNNYKCICNYSKAPKAIEVKINESVKGNIDEILSEIEELCPSARKIWKTISTIKSDLEKKSPLSRMKGRKSRTLERKKILTENIGNEKSPLHDCAWTCKYKPMSAEEIVGNEEAAGKLKDWLSGWRASLTKEDDGSSGDEFYSSDCSSSCNNREDNQIAVLLGPYGSGKTASVYAVAEEFGYSILEVNASSRRTGKKILKELEEATKSHRIKKSKHKSPFERIANENEVPKISQNSLILLEDVDLIFEEDEGFVSAAYHLASKTKRPIVMTCRDMCPHLNKMAPQLNKIYFQKVNGSRVFALLELISLAETNRRLPHNYLMKLLQAGDLRQALLQSQYLLLSGQPILSERSTTIKPSLWQSVQRYLYKPAIKMINRHRTRKGTNIKRFNGIACVLNNLAENLDSLSLVSTLVDIEDTMLNISEEKMQPNLSLAENISFYSASHDLKADIATFISNQIFCIDSNANEHLQNQNNIILRKRLNRGVDLALSHVTSACLDQRIMALDYLPTVRTICRAEEFRSTINYKRSNRFFHYLHSYVPTASMKPNILAAACKMLQERENKPISA